MSIIALKNGSTRNFVLSSLLLSDSIIALKNGSTRNCDLLHRFFPHSIIALKNGSTRNSQISSGSRDKKYNRFEKWFNPQQGYRTQLYLLSIIALKNGSTRNRKKL